MAGRHDASDHSKYRVTGLIIFLCLIALIPGLVIGGGAATARPTESGVGLQFFITLVGASLLAGWADSGGGFFGKSIFVECFLAAFISWNIVSSINLVIVTKRNSKEKNEINK